MAYYTKFSRTLRLPSRAGRHCHWNKRFVGAKAVAVLMGVTKFHLKVVLPTPRPQLAGTRGSCRRRPAFAQRRFLIYPLPFHSMRTALPHAVAGLRPPHSPDAVVVCARRVLSVPSAS